MNLRRRSSLGLSRRVSSQPQRSTSSASTCTGSTAYCTILRTRNLTNSRPHTPELSNRVPDHENHGGPSCWGGRCVLIRHFLQDPCGSRSGMRLGCPSSPLAALASQFVRACRNLGVFQSMGRVGSCFDNAVSEAFNSVLKVEYVHRHTFATRAEARIKIATWIADFYNTRRLHSICGFKSPIDHEHAYRTDLAMRLAA
ncbi:integrase core domain-containing protein [Streptomyces sp. NPDC004044]